MSKGRKLHPTEESLFNILNKEKSQERVTEFAEGIKLLLEAKKQEGTPSLNTLGLDGDPLLQIAAEQKDEQIVKLTLETKADVNQRNKYSNTALTASAFHGSLSIVKLLVEAKAELNMQEDLPHGENTALTQSLTRMRAEYLDVALVLLKAGANPSVKVGILKKQQWILRFFGLI